MKFQGVEVEDFDPADPHCWQCERHLFDVEPVVLAQLTHRVTRVTKNVILCGICAISDDGVLTAIVEREARRDRLN